MNFAQTAVILLNWNGFQDTVQCIESLALSREPIRIYVVDNGSRSDEAAELQRRYPDILVLAQNENLGFCGGNNVGISQAIRDGATYILLLNNDTLVPQNSIHDLKEAFLAQDRIFAISPVIFEYPQTRVVWFSKAKWIPERAQFTLHPASWDAESMPHKAIWKSEFACGCCLFTSSEMIRKVGLLDERYFAYYDEADWCKRAERLGLHSFVTTSSFIYHKVSRTTPALVSTYLLTRNRLLWMKENLTRSERRKSRYYLIKEWVWHRLNTLGIVSGSYSKKHSAALLQGMADYRKRLFGKWSTKAEKIIFDK